jgi:hypothetical protein
VWLRLGQSGLYASTPTGCVAVLSDHIAVLKLNRQRCADYLLSFLFARDLVVDRSVYLLRNRVRRISSGVARPPPRVKNAWLARHRVGPQIIFRVEEYEAWPEAGAPSTEAQCASLKADEVSGGTERTKSVFEGRFQLAPGGCESSGPVVLKTNLRTIGVDHCLSEYLIFKGSGKARGSWPCARHLKVPTTQIHAQEGAPRHDQ